ncbi:MAG: cellulose binding domain-containing protein [Isosphaeraceae bacterium]
MPGRRRALARLESLEGRALLTSATFQLVQDWGSGLQGSIAVSNTGPAVPGWRLEFDYAPNITSIWDGRILAHAGTHYTIGGSGWNDALAAGGSVSFGFVAAPGGSGAVPANYLLNGVPISGGPALPPPLTISVADAAVDEGNSGTTTLPFTVSLSAASRATVTVAYATSNGTAAAGSDYQATSGTLTFAPGETSKTLNVRVTGDTVVEPDETLNLVLSNPSGAILGRAQAVGTIRNDDAPPSSGGGLSSSVTYQITSDWGTGFNAQVTVKNTSATSLNGWTLAFDLPSTITSLWDGKVASRSGNRYAVGDAGWNASLPPGGSASFGFTASTGSSKAASNFVLSGPGGGTNPGGPPVAVADSAYTLVGRAVNIPVLANDTDPNGYALHLASVTPGQNGTATANADGTVTYTPRAGFAGTDAFTYAVDDGHGATATGNVSVSVTATPVSPGRVFNPYVDMGLWPTPDIASMARDQGIKYFTLAFITAVQGTNQPAWAGLADYAVNGGAFDQQVRSQINAVRALGGDATISFGGASGVELAQAITDVSSLKGAYRTVVDAYGATSIDLDIEGAAAADHASIDRRSQALAALQSDLAAQGKSLQVWLTLPVLPTGLTGDGVYVVQSAQRYGVRLAGVNVMAMDYGDYAAPNPTGHMGDYAIQAATSTFNQLKSTFGTAYTDPQLWSMVGVTPMIGMNDVTTEVFDQAAARQLLAFAQQKGLGRLAMWSLSRDRSAPGGAVSYVGSNFSSIVQTPYEFSGIFKPFSGS